MFRGDRRQSRTPAPLRYRRPEPTAIDRDRHAQCRNGFYPTVRTTGVVTLAHAGFLVAAVATHALVGYTLGAVAFDDPRAGLVGGVFADIDLLVPAAWGGPFVHRGLTHSLLAAVFVTALAAARGRRTAGGVGVGYASHLLVDATTPMGVPVASPLSTTHVGLDLGGHSPPATAFLWVCCLAVLWQRER